VQEWVKAAGARNEALDCFVYALAAYYQLGLHRWRPQEWQRLEELVQPVTADLFAAPPPDAVEVKPVPRPGRARRGRKKGGLLQGGIRG